MSVKKKINWLLILQGWAMLWVVFGHSFLGTPGEGPEWENALFHFAYSFHMPLFMLVSGWLFYLTRLNTNGPGGGGKIWSYGEIVKDKALRLLLPGFVFSLVAFALKIAMPGEVSRQAGLSFQEIAHQYLYPNDNPMRELWFIATLFWFFLLSPLWKLILKNEWSRWLALLAFSVIHFWHPNTEFLCIGRVFDYVIWFYLGLLISKTNLIDKLLIRNAWLTLLLGIVIYAIGTITDAFITTIGGITLSFGLALLLDRYIPMTFFSFRNYTYQIFLMGIFAQILVKMIFRHIHMPYVAAYFLCLLAGVYVPVIISKILEWINWKSLLLCVGLKKK